MQPMHAGVPTPFMTGRKEGRMAVASKMDGVDGWLQVLNINVSKTRSLVFPDRVRMSLSLYLGNLPSTIHFYPTTEGHRSLRFSIIQMIIKKASIRFSLFRNQESIEQKGVWLVWQCLVMYVSIRYRESTTLIPTQGRDFFLSSFLSLWCAMCLCVLFSGTTDIHLLNISITNHKYTFIVRISL